MIEFVDKTESQSGTKINRFSLMAIQGFIPSTIEFMQDGSIKETNSLGQIKTTTFEPNGNVKEVFEGEYTITKTTIFNSDGSITEEIE